MDITELAMVEDRGERLARLDEATERIDQVLTQLVPTTAASMSAEAAKAKTGETRPALAR